MRGYMTIAQPKRLSLLLSIIFVVACVLTTTALSQPRGLTLNLIHRDLIYPPTNTHDSAGLSKAKSTNQTSYNIKQVGILRSMGPIFFLQYFIGTPGIRQYAVMDTGSSFPIIQCTGPEVRRLSDFYNESRSSSYNTSSCHQQYCQLIPHSRCDEESRCEYNTQFQDTSRNKGHIGFETISFSDGGHRNQSAIIKDVLFGCGTDNYSPHGYNDGIFGIGGLLPLSIVRKTQMNRFSFCYMSVNDRSNRQNHLALGSDARLEGDSVSYQDRFGITVNSIIIGSIQLKMRNFIVYIDSGSAVSYFEPIVYNAIKSKVSNIIGTHMRPRNSTYFQGGLCYEPTNIWRGLPNVIIESGGLHLFVLNMEGMFVRSSDNAICLAIKLAVNRNLLGATQMQYYNVGFDLDSMRAYFKRKTSCNRLP